MNTFIYIWLILIGSLHVIAGILVSFFISFDQQNSYINYLFNTLKVNPEEIDTASLALISSLLKLFGPVILGWGLLFLLLIYCLKNATLINKQFHRLKFACIVSIIAWYGLDSFIAWQVGLNFHLEFNLIIIAFIIFPLALFRPTNTHD
ncbi:MAG: hypothetical protein ACRBCS_02575 [Cellvibrionaceae bacterium]